MSRLPPVVANTRVPVAMLALAGAWLAPMRAVRAQGVTFDTVLTREVGPGVVLRRLMLQEGPVVMHVLEVDLRRPELTVGAVRACDRAAGRERPSAIAKRLRADGVEVVAVLNAGFFDLRGGTGASESSVVVDGRIAKAVEVTESPFDLFDNVHSQFAMLANGRPAIDRFRLVGTVRSPRGRWTLGAINGIPAHDRVSLYTAWSDPPRLPLAARSASVPLQRLSERGDTTRYRVLPTSPDTVTDTTRTRALLVGVGTVADGVSRLRAGDVVTAIAALSPRPAAVRALVGGWPRIVRGGASVAEAADSVEGTFPRFSTARNPRSVVGFSRDSATLYLVVVDGRQASSVGMSLAELARAMIAIGAHDALNLDGGGSTALVVGDSVVNAVSDRTGERPVGDVLVVTRRPEGAAIPGRRLPATRPPPSCILPGAPVTPAH